MTNPDSPCPVPPSTPPTRTAPPPTLTSQRSLRQLSLFFAGSTFFALSTLITRRALTRRRLAIFPSFYHPSNQPPKQPVDGALEAVEALGLATVNVLSVGMLAVGGTLWALDIGSLEDLQRKVRRGMGGEGSASGIGKGDREMEEEWEEWLAGVVERRKWKGKGKVRGEGEGDEAEGVRDERGKRR
ncbi:hypothetical protein MMC17_003905 [Xylographa soralifera]|nr:hypothetical protein [Xylographa soralifera]